MLLDKTTCRVGEGKTGEVCHADFDFLGCPLLDGMLPRYDTIGSANQ